MFWPRWVQNHFSRAFVLPVQVNVDNLALLEHDWRIYTNMIGHKQTQEFFCLKTCCDWLKSFRWPWLMFLAKIPLSLIFSLAVHMQLMHLSLVKHSHTLRWVGPGGMLDWKNNSRLVHDSYLFNALNSKCTSLFFYNLQSIQIAGITNTTFHYKITEW